MLKSWQFYAVAAVILGKLALVVAGCSISDKHGEPTRVSETVPTGESAPIKQVEHSGEAASAGGVATPNQAVHSSEAGSVGKYAPPNGTELADSVNVSPRSDSPAPLRLRIFEASAIVRASLISSAAGEVRYSEALGLDLDGEPLTSFNVIFDKLGPGGWPEDGEYRAAHTFRFRVIEYLKGSGASEIAVTARTFSTRGTEEQALQVATDSLGERDTSRDSHEAILFLWEPASDGASTDAFYFLRSGPYPSLHYTIDTMNRVWLPAKDPPAAEGESSTSDDSAPLFFTGDPSEATPSTMSLGDLRSEITAVDALIAAGDGTEEYRECLGKMWRYEHVRQGERRRFPPESVHQLASGTPAGTVVHLYSGSDYGPRYSRKLIQGVDKDLFRAVRVDDDDRPDNGYRIGDAIARPLPAGMYQYKSYYQDYAFIPCNFVPYNWYRIRYVTVTAPAGVLHELFFDPVTVGSGIAADATNGVLKPVAFTDANGASATIEGISYESPSTGSGQAGTVEIEVDPHAALTGQIVDIIELDGTVSLSLDDADATVDDANDTLSWSVSSQPWEDGDKLMVRIRMSPTLLD